jgi:hypothetical protein
MLAEPVTALPVADGDDDASPFDTSLVAYCAPGCKAMAELVLAIRGERVREIVEHPWLAGDDDTVIVADMDAALTPDPPVSFAPETCGICGRPVPWHRMDCLAFPWDAVMNKPVTSTFLIAGI